MSDRTFKVESPPMKGNDVEAWQESIVALFKKFKLPCPLKTDGVYGVGTRSMTSALVYACGLSPKRELKNGVTPELRVKLRANKLTPAQSKVIGSKPWQTHMAKLKKQWTPVKVHTPVTKIVTDDWGFHPGVHDGEDVVTLPDPPIFAMVKCKIIDVRSAGWWGLGAPTNPKLKAKGDGIIQMEVLEDIGPFKYGMHIGYGHAEKATVKVGQIVNAGTMVGHAGFANAWHIHLMVNDGSTTKGIGTMDPRPFVDYAVKHG